MSRHVAPRTHAPSRASPASSRALARAIARTPRAYRAPDASRRRQVFTRAENAPTLASLLVTNADGLLADITANIDAVVLDCDGVIWHGNTLIPGAKLAVETLRSAGARVFFATNNATKSRAEYAAKFAALGMNVSKYEIYTSAYATACYLRSKGFDEVSEEGAEFGANGERLDDAKKPSVYVIGERGILDELAEANIDVEAGVYDSVRCSPQDWEEMRDWLDEGDDVGAVVVGSDSSFTFAKLAYASLMIQRGARFIATNPDAADLFGPGLYPGAGALVDAVAKASGKAPEIYAGKPSGFMLDLLSEHTGIDLSRTLVIGDRLDTDVAFGKAGKAAMTALVMTGVATMDDVEALVAEAATNADAAAALPDRIVGSLAELVGLDFDPDEICASVVPEPSMLDSFPVSDDDLPDMASFLDDDYDRDIYDPAS
jgi:phosphoglycolate/pyridoxal phosphate phosphatase family enzyme